MSPMSASQVKLTVDLWVALTDWGRTVISIKMTIFFKAKITIKMKLIKTV